MDNKKKIGIIAGIAAVLLAVGLAVFFYSKGDHRGPNMTLVSGYEANYGEQIGLYDLVRAISDESDYSVRITDGGQISADGRYTVFSKAGNETVEITAEDAGGHKTVKTVSIKVTDAKPPMLHAGDITISLGDRVDYRTGVTAEDEMDGNLTGKIQVDTSQVDETKAGVYPVIYTVTDNAGNEATVRTALTIKSPEAQSVTLSRQSVMLDGNDHYQLTASVEPRAWTGKVEWASSNPKVAVVSDGLVTWVGSGSCTITATAGGAASECQVECGYVAVSSLKIDVATLELDYMEHDVLETRVVPSNWNGNVVWTSSDPTVATVENGAVYWQGEGECVITATADGRTSTCAVTCNAPEIETLDITEEHINLDENQTYQTNPVVEPDAWQGELVWTSSDTSVATVTDGNVRWVGAGTCTITVTAGELSDSVEVTCKESFLDGFIGGLFGDGDNDDNGDNVDREDTGEQ